jgi:RNA polymerase sigma-70 factor (ECF subfamily)
LEQGGRVTTADDEFDAWYLGCRDRLVMQVAAMCGDRVEAMDFVQEAFVRAWARWPRVGRYDDPEGWVRRVAVNLAIGRWRRAKNVVLQDHVATRLDPSSGEQGATMAALATLPLNHRRAIVLHHLVGLPVDDVATQLGAPVGTVKSWLSRGRTQLAAALTAAEEYSHD